MGKSPGASRIPAGPKETSGGGQCACVWGILYAEKAEITPREGEEGGNEEPASCPLPGAEPRSPAAPPRCLRERSGERGAPAAAAPSPCAARRAGDKSDIPCVCLAPAPSFPRLPGSASPPQGQGSAAGPASPTDRGEGGTVSWGGLFAWVCWVWVFLFSHPPLIIMGWSGRAAAADRRRRRRTRVPVTAEEAAGLRSRQHGGLELPPPAPPGSAHPLPHHPHQVSIKRYGGEGEATRIPLPSSDRTMPHGRTWTAPRFGEPLPPPRAAGEALGAGPPGPQPRSLLLPSRECRAPAGGHGGQRGSGSR